MSLYLAVITRQLRCWLLRIFGHEEMESGDCRDGEATSAEVYCFVVVSVIYGWEGKVSAGGLVRWQG